jgi:hypothetical protein
MDVAYLSALSALAGSAIGGLASCAATWLAQNSQARALSLSLMRTKRETLYGAFMDEAARLFIDAIAHDLDDAAKLLPIYAVIGKIRLFGAAEVVRQTANVVHEIKAAYQRPTMTLEQVRTLLYGEQADPLKEFSESCRADLAELDG